MQLKKYINLRAFLVAWRFGHKIITQNFSKKAELSKFPKFLRSFRWNKNEKKFLITRLSKISWETYKYFHPSNFTLFQIRLFIFWNQILEANVACLCQAVIGMGRDFQSQLGTPKQGSAFDKYHCIKISFYQSNLIQNFIFLVESKGFRWSKNIFSAW